MYTKRKDELRKKKLLTITLAIFSCFMSFGNTCFADNGITVKIDGHAVAFDVSPQIINNRTMVPMRKIFETLGLSILYRLLY